MKMKTMMTLMLLVFCLLPLSAEIETWQETKNAMLSVDLEDPQRIFTGASNATYDSGYFDSDLIGLVGVIDRTDGLADDKMYTFNNSHASYYPGASGISMKVLYENATGRILGAQLIGAEGADKRCDVLATAIRAKMTAADLTELELCYAPPYGSAKDPVNYAGYAIENVRSGLVHPYYWHDVAGLPRDGSVTLLDVRTPAEYACGHIDGFVNIPLDELRQHLSELDPAKPVYLHCHSGLRSYLACRILTGYGFDCHNLAGGYRFYSLVVNETRAA